VNSYDYIIVGSGIAGLYASLMAKEHGSVLILTKGSIEDTNTRYAQGGIAAAIGDNDSAELHYKDTISAGAGLCDAEAVRILVDEAPDRIADLIRFGVPFDTLDGAIALTKEAAHTVPRVLHAGGDATGEHIEVTLSRQVRQSRIKVLEYTLATEIIIEGNRAAGVRTIDCRTGISDEYACRFLILATGGAGKLFKYTTNQDVATGDGIALAYRAGAEICDIEFIQFHPTAIRLPGVHPFLISEAVRGEGGILRNNEGKPFMPGYAREAELAPRDIVARAIIDEMRKTQADRVFLDVTHLPPSLVTTRFPHIYQFCLDHGIDITSSRIPVAPAAHYMMGGVKVNSWGETNIGGLFAAGETANTGVHGANRLASNSLLETIVFGMRIIDRTRSNSGNTPVKASGGALQLGRRKKTAQSAGLSLLGLQSLMWEKVGIVRSGASLAEAAAVLAHWEELLPPPVDRPSYELNNLVLNARLITEAALVREESRGAHYRTDFPKPVDGWQKHIIFRREKQE
jgi:L-aspartate oxidase